MKKFLITTLKFFLFFIGWSLLISLTPDIPTNNHVLLRLWWEFAPFLVIVLFSLFFTFIIEKNYIHISIFKNYFKNLVIGLLIGSIWLGIPLGVFIFTGIMKITTINKIDYIFIWILSSLLNVIMQELLIRGYLYQLLKYNYNSIIACIFTTILFTALHGGAFEAGIIPVLNIITMSIFMTIILEYTETLLAPIVVHFIWNTLGCIIFGVVSLASDYPSLFSNTFTGSILISGGIYKVEGSIIVLLINSLLILIFFRLNKNKQHKNKRKPLSD